MRTLRHTPFAIASALVVTMLSACSAMSLLHDRSHDLGLHVGREHRTYIIHVPKSYHRDTPAPLVILLHGHGSRAETFERLTGMSDKAEEKGFIVVYPQALGSPSVWHTGVDGSPSVDDLAFIRELIAELRTRYDVDPARIYVGGHSNGAFMAYRVGAALSSTVAAIGISAGSIGRSTARGDTVRVQAPDVPVAVIAFHGKADNAVPYDGGKETDGPRRIVPVAQSIELWVNADGCRTTPDSTVLETGNVIRDDYSGCRAGTEVVLYTINDGTHRWPGDPTPWWHFWGRTGGTLSATDQMWSFFESHPKVITPITN
ncbi:MAG: hypothetical protein M3Z30_03290 [Gemmatimonadota bacterium]|nr:hypothetical protein [Gemmatimonadota bacterium]